MFNNINELLANLIESQGGGQVEIENVDSYFQDNEQQYVVYVKDSSDQSGYKKYAISNSHILVFIANMALSR